MSRRSSFVRTVLGITGVAVAGAALYVYFSDDAKQQLEAMLNREKVKLYVKHQLKAPEALINAVDSLSDREINTLLSIVDKADQFKAQSSDVFQEIVRRSKEVVDRVSDLI